MILVTGASGQLGSDILLELQKQKQMGIGTDLKCNYLDAFSVVKDQKREFAKSFSSFSAADITKEEIVDVIRNLKPDAVIHCAAWTAVDAAEDEENKEKVYAINVLGTQNIANACKEVGCKMMYISTDYVFDGNGTELWQPDCKSFAPQNYYGQTKYEGELAVVNTLEKFFIVRIAWVFGKNGNNFPKTMLKLAETHDTLRVINDQIGTPTYTPDLARLLVDMIQTDKYGYYHATNEGGYISWYDFACEVFRQAGKDVKVIPVSTEEYGLSKARRPYNSRLDKSKLTDQGFGLLPDWKDALHRYLIETGVIDK